METSSMHKKVACGEGKIPHAMGVPPLGGGEVPYFSFPSYFFINKAFYKDLCLYYFISTPRDASVALALSYTWMYSSVGLTLFTS